MHLCESTAEFLTLFCLSSSLSHVLFPYSSPFLLFLFSSLPLLSPSSYIIIPFGSSLLFHLSCSSCFFLLSHLLLSLLFQPLIFFSFSFSPISIISLPLQFPLSFLLYYAVMLLFSPPFLSLMSFFHVLFVSFLLSSSRHYFLIISCHLYFFSASLSQLHVSFRFSPLSFLPFLSPLSLFPTLSSAFASHRFSSPPLAPAQGCSSPIVVKFADTQKDKEQRRLQQQLAQQMQQLNSATTWGSLTGLGGLTPQYLAVRRAVASPTSTT